MSTKKKIVEKISETNEQILNKIFPLLVRPMTIFGVWPNNRTPYRKIIFVLFTFMYIQGPMVVYVVKNRNNFLEASYAICEMIGGVIYYGRLLFLGIFSQLYLEILQDLTQAWRNANISGLKEWKDFRTKYEKYSYRVTAFMILYYVMAAVQFSLVSISTQLFRFYVLGKDVQFNFSHHADFIVNVLDPFDIKGYLKIVIPMNFASQSFTYVFCLVGVFYPMMIYCTGFLFRMICFKLNDLDQNLDKMREDEVLTKLKEIIIDHQKAIRTAKNLEEAVRYPMLIQVMDNSFFICIVGFDIFAIESDNTTIINLVGYGSAILFELFLNSYVSDVLTREVAQVPVFIWNTKWYTQSPKVRRHFLLFMVYGQTTIGISAGKFYLVSLNSFLKVVRTGISYFTLMQKVYSV